MDYYKEFSGEAANRTKAIVQQRDELAQAIEQGKKNLVSEQGVIQKLKDEREKLKSSSSVELTDDSQSFQEFKDSLSKLDSDIEKAERMCETLQEIIPQKTTALRTVREQIKSRLKAYFLECQPINAKEVRTKIDIAAAEKQSFHDAFRKIFRDAGTSFQSFAVDRETSAAYKAFRVSPRISRPKQPAPTPEPQESVRPEQPETKTLLTGEPDKTPEPVRDEQPSESVVSAQ